MLPEPAGFPWVLSHEVLKDMGNAGTYGANDYYNDGNGHLVRIATPEAGTGAEFADDEVPSTVIALASGNRIGVSWVGESTLNTYYMVELWRPLDDVTLSFPDITYHSTTSTAVLATGLRSSEEYFCPRPRGQRPTYDRLVWLLEDRHRRGLRPVAGFHAHGRSPHPQSVRECREPLPVQR